VRGEISLRGAALVKLVDARAIDISIVLTEIVQFKRTARKSDFWEIDHYKT